MITIKSIQMSSNATINKALLSGLDLEDKFDSHCRVIDALRYEYIHRRLSKQDLDYVLYSKYGIDKRINEYDDDTLLILVEFGLEYEKIARTKGAYTAKREIIDRFQYLHTLAHDEINDVSQNAMRQLERLNDYLQCKRAYLKVFLALDQSICRARFITFTSKIRVTNCRHSHFRNECYEESQGIVTHTLNGFQFDVTVPIHSTYHISEWEEYRLKHIFDEYSRNGKGIHLRKLNLTLDRLVALVHLFFEHLD